MDNTFFDINKRGCVFLVDFPSRNRYGESKLEIIHEGDNVNQVLKIAYQLAMGRDAEGERADFEIWKREDEGGMLLVVGKVFLENLSLKKKDNGQSTDRYRG